jgi:AraC-like DNA-binding protein
LHREGVQSTLKFDLLLTTKSTSMSSNGQALYQRQLPTFTTLPRAVYARAESLAQPAGTRRHSHTWVQLTYAIQGVLEVRTDEGRFIALPKRAIWLPEQMEHEVFSSSNAEIRSLYLDVSVTEWAPSRCRVLEISPLTHELIRSFSALPTEYETGGPAGRLVEVLLDQLREARELAFSLPWPTVPSLDVICRTMQAHPDASRTLHDWSLELGCSEKTLSRQFLAQTGLTFRAWRQRLRLFSALVPLERGDRVTDVALACGYDSTSAFIAAFRQQFGETPGELFRR